MGKERASSNKALLEKLLEFAVRVVKLSGRIKKDEEVATLVQPLVTSATAIGQYCTEAQEATTRDEFIEKVNLALVRARATQYMLRVLQYGGFEDKKGDVRALEEESDGIADILNKSIRAMQEEA